MHNKVHFQPFRSLIFLTVFLSFLAATSNLNAQKIYFPEKNKVWKTKSPQEFGIDQSTIDKTIAFAKENEYSGSKDMRINILESFKHEPFISIVGPTKHRGGPAGLIVKNGYIIGQWGDVDRVDMTFSVTKSYLSTVAGLALDDGLIKNMNDKVADYVWDETFQGEHNSKISWHHLLTQSSDWSGNFCGKYDWADRPPNEGGIDDWKYRKLNEPGTVFKYNDVRVNVTAYALLQVWRRSLPQVLKERIMDPIGASSTWRWFGYETTWVNMDGIKVQSVSGGGHSGGGLFINTYDHARFGLLFLNNGNWNGKQLISKEWVKAVQKPSEAYGSYGYMWWLNQGSRSMEGAPANIYYASGFGGNNIVIDETNNIVIVTRWLEPSKLGEFLKVFYEGL